MIYTVPGIIEAVHDGDTLYATADLGWDLHIFVRCRILHINSPEVATDAGKEARAYAQTIARVGDAITIHSHGWDKFGGRTDATITLADGSDFGNRMLSTGHAVPYEGGAR